MDDLIDRQGSDQFMAEETTLDDLDESGSEVDEELQGDLVDDATFCLAAHTGNSARHARAYQAARILFDTFQYASLSAEPVYAVAWAGPSSKVVATGGGDDLAMLWKLVGGPVERWLELHMFLTSLLMPAVFPRFKVKVVSRPLLQSNCKDIKTL